MSQNELTAGDLISMGVNLLTLELKNRADLSNYRVHAQSMVQRLSKAGFVSSLQIAEPLAKEAEKLDGDFQGAVKFSRNETQFKAIASSLDAVMMGEADSKSLILTDVKPPDEISQFANLARHQEALRGDLVTCLKAHLARPAIVMAWALGYDLIRSWVFNETTHRLPAFNSQLASNPRRGEPVAVNDYHDFFRIGETRFLEICRDSQHASLQRFTDRTFRDLQGLLDQRNEFAHANYSSANEHEANVYVVRMVRIVTNPPFV